QTCALPIFFEISTDKVDTEVPSPAAGTLTKILVQEGQTVSVKTPIAEINGAGAAAGGAAGAGESAGAGASPDSAREPAEPAAAATDGDPPDSAQQPAPPPAAAAAESV